MAYPQRQWAGGDNLFSRTPVTVTIIGIWVVGFLAAVAQIPLFIRLFVFDPRVLPNAVTGLATYPLVMGRDIIGLLINGLIFYWFGGSLERGWGSRTYALFLLTVNVAAAMAWQIGAILFLGGLDSLATPWLMMSAVIVAWAWLNPEATILLWFVLPVKAKWVGWISIALLYFLFPASQVPGLGGVRFFLLGFFALGGAAVALWYAKWRREYGWIPRQRRERAPKSRAIRHPAASPWRRLLRPFEDWQRRRRIARLQRTFKIDEEERRSD